MKRVGAVWKNSRGLRVPAWATALWALGGLAGCMELELDEEVVGTDSAEVVGENLGGANLGGANLAGNNLGGANLAGNNLGGVNLGGTNLAGANLGGANLGGANLAGNNLGGANLAGANLAGANLAGANLAGANLAGANLAGSDLGGSNVAGLYPGEPCPISNTVAGALGSDLTASSVARNIHGGTPLGMLRSGEDKYTRTSACVVMGFGSTAFGKLVDRIRTGGATTVNVALRDLEWGFADTSGGPMVLRAWEVVVWGANKYSVFLIGAPPATEWAGVAGFVKAVWRWAAPPSMTVKIGRIGGGATVLSYGGMMDAGRRYVAGEINERSYIAGLLTFTTATTNNVGVTVDFSSWARKTDGTGAILGNVTTPSGPTHAEAAYVAQEKSDGSVSIVIRPVDTWNRSTNAATGIASGLLDLESAYTNWQANPTTPKPIPLRCAGALLVKALNVDETAWQYKCDSTVTFAGHGDTAPAPGSDDTIGAGAWSAYASGTALPYNSYMTIQPTNGMYKRCASAAMDQSSQNESCGALDQMPVLAETLVHTWSPAFDTTSIPVEIDAGEHFTCVRRGDKTVWCWGMNDVGRIGRPFDNAWQGNWTNPPGPVVLADGATKLSDIIEVATGYEESCARKSDNTVWCWGNNANGGIGDGTMVTRQTPVQNPITNVTRLAMGRQFGCARKSDSTVWCWGLNSTGQLGNGATTSQPTPVQVKVNASTFLTGVTQVASGESSSCAVKTDGTIWCWGLNSSGQLGNGNKVNQLYALQVPNFGTVASAAVGSANTCAIKSDGSLWCWGHNGYGQIGSGSTGTDALIPTRVKINATTYLAGVDQISSRGYALCARKTDGTAWCWGFNWGGWLGIGNTTNQPYATQVMGVGNTVQQIALGNAQSCMILSTGDVKCAGELALMGRPGVISTIQMPVTALGTSVSEVAVGGSHTCARKTDNTVWCWGWGWQGRLGDNSNVARSLPVQVRTGASAYLTNVAEIDATDKFSCARKSDGTVWCWGANEYWQHTVQTPAENRMAVQIKASASASLTNVQGIALGDAFVCARKVSGATQEVWCWGRNASGQLGIGNTTQQQYPVKVSSWTDVAEVAAGANHACARRIDGTVWCWGRNGSGRLGDGTTVDRLSPVQVKINATTGLTGVTAIYAPVLGSSTCAKKSDGTLWCWGFNMVGQLGDGTTTSRSYATQATALGGNVADAGLATGTSCVRKTDNSVHCVGLNGEGMLGTGTTTNSITTAVHIADGVTQLSGLSRHYCARKTSGALMCWGANNLGQLGQGHSLVETVPVTTLPW